MKTYSLRVLTQNAKIHDSAVPKYRFQCKQDPPDPPTVHSHSPWHNREHWDMTLQVKDPRALVAAQDIAALVARSAVIIVGIHRLYR